jgi:membrane associated rhomboid family serine protease
VLSLVVIHSGLTIGLVREKTQVYQTFGLSRHGLGQGHWHSFLSYGFIHASWYHLLCNALMLLVMGAKLEGWLGAKRMCVMGLIGILGGGLFHLACGGRSTDLLVGASGLVMAQLLVFCTLSPESRMMPLPVSARNLGMGVIASSCILMLINPAAAVPGFSQIGILLSQQGLGDWFTIGHACHFGGAISGYLYARWLLRVPLTREKLLEKRLKKYPVSSSEQ